MGDPSDFYSGRGKSKRVKVLVKYRSGRNEIFDFGTEAKAHRYIDMVLKTGVVKSAVITGKFKS